ncbi:hypothetical protein HanPSC8_Chr17g0792311 [Helianthus annuus]|nr:hypothetical protein HanPSC8_Chr17g0792311 [Helianthus annuus]
MHVVTMSSSASSGIYDDVDPMEISSDSFTLLDPILDDVRMEDDVLAAPPQHHEIIIIGHPEGEHLVQILPIDVIPLAAVPFMELSDDEDEVPIIHVDHLDDEIGDGEVF